MSTITLHSINAAFQELSHKFGPDFQLDENGSCLLTYKNDLPLVFHFVEEGGRLILGSELIGDLEGKPAEIWLQILGMDWLGFGSHGCALSPDYEAGNITIWRDAKLETVSGPQLESALELFLDDVLSARQALSELDLGGTEATTIESSTEVIRA